MSRKNFEQIPPNKKYRGVQWGAGNVGTRAMSSISQHPNMTLVGLKELGEKVGKDAGELCGLGPIGIIATDSIDEVIALKPDCVMYMQQGCDFDDVCKLLASGANIVTTCLKFHHPAHLDPEVRKRVEEACRRGNSSIHCSGSSPGFITEAVPFGLTSIMRRLDCLTINGFADMSLYPHPFMLFDIMGYGTPPDKFAEFKEHVLENFRPSFSLVADALSLPLDSFEVSEEVATARNETSIVAGVIKKGTIAARRVTLTGKRGGSPSIRFCANWYVTTDINKPWDLGATGRHVVAQGDPPLDVEIHFPVPKEKFEEVSPGLTAYRPINAIPFVCAAPPGIQTSVDLHKIIAKLG